MNNPFDPGTDAAWLKGVIDSARKTASELSAALTEGEPAANSIPGYQILREIHRGAQGVVYQAIQRATQRKVAIKLLSSGEFASPRAKARFRREIRVLGQFRHPNIVSVHDSGSADGNFYYVMDYISGQTLDAYMASGDRTVPQTLDLFARICEAVNAAHLRGIIHRDLKPGNILVDLDGEPHVVDFGLAKAALGQWEDGAHTQIVSRTGEFTGSLPWASPEQALGNSGTIDIRTDVYSLGVVLFQMLTRTFPYAVAGNLRDVLDNIINAEPARPRTLRREIDGDVETIVLKALAKDPDRRYQSAGELARDIRSYLAGEPISAKRDSTLYVLGKKIRRHRAPIALSTAVFGLAVVFAGVLSVMRQKAAAAEQKAVRIQMAFMGSVLEAINPGSKTLATIDDLPALAAQIDDELDGYPLVQAELYERIGKVLRRLASFDRAEPYLNKSLDIRLSLLDGRDADVASSLHQLGAFHWEMGNYVKAESLYRQSLDIRREVFGPQHVLVAESMHHLGAALRALGRYTESEQVLRETLDLRMRVIGSADPQVAATTNELASTLMDTGRYLEAEPLFRRALVIVEQADPRKLREEERPQYRDRAQTTLGACLVELGEHQEAAELLERSLDSKRQTLGEAHPSYALTLHWMAKLEFQTGDVAQAEPLARKALEIRQAVWPLGHPHIASSQALLGEILLRQNRAAEAEPILTAALEIDRTMLPVNHWHTAHVASLLGRCLMRQGDTEEAEELLVEGMESLRLARGDSDGYAQGAIERLAELYRATARPELATPLENILQRSTPANGSH